VTARVGAAEPGDTQGSDPPPFGDLLVRNGHVATMAVAISGASGAEPYGAVRNAALAVRAGRIAWVGPEADLPSELADLPTLDARGGWVTPGLVDCHTHLVFGGDRAGEFERRLQGATYEEIARAGGGILSTVRATRAASESELVEAGEGRLGLLARRGVTTVEIKSGYGLEVDSELRMLRVAQTLGERTGVRVRTTLLGAHALPPEYRDDRDAYVRLVCEEMIPAAARAGLADAVDAFCEEIAFSPEECGRVFDAAAAHGLAVRLHADQRTDQGGAALAARHGARSADHLEHTDEDGVRAMAAAGTVAVLLPGAAHFLRDTAVPPVAAFRAHGVPMAVATDLNPGSSPLLDPVLTLSLACLLFRLTPEEALAGMTRVAAGVLGLEREIGTVEVGKWADLAVWDVAHPAELAYWMGGAACRVVVRKGMPLTV
jgi:imidazolonepropionase